MTLDKLGLHSKAKIKAIKCNDALKDRFYSFGITKGTELLVEEITLSKSTIKIKIGNSKIALRMSEAKNIELENIEIKDVK